MSREGGTAQALRQSMRAHPDWSAAEHARSIGVSRQRVCQLKDQLGLTLPNKRGWQGGPLPRPGCETCGEPVPSLYGRWHRGCRPSQYGVPARSAEYQRRWQRDYYRRKVNR
jgi:hypothetical protein